MKNQITKSLSGFLLLVALAVGTAPAHAVPIAIVDSGTDLNHPELRDVKWTNLKDEDDAVDNDDNGYIDDTHGWNFAEMDNRLFEKRLLGKFKPEVYRFFAVQTKLMRGTATEEEIAWMKNAVKDQAFLIQLQTFGNFVHGSHVAGIAAAGSPKSEIMPLKLIPTRIPRTLRSIERNGMVARAKAAKNEERKKKIILMALEFLAKNQGQLFTPISAYMKDQGARVANCSFGTGSAQAKMMLKPLLEAVFKREISDAELAEYVVHFINAISKTTAESFVHAAPGTLFVMAAGNDGTNNDEMPASPANIKADNTITVAALNGTGSLASFSNFGLKMVDIAAPGVGIRSPIPGGEYLELSGTSQAAPYVANIAGQILDTNPDLLPGQVRQILIGTVDQKDFLLGKVSSGGMANGSRAIAAARHSLSEPLDVAIQRSVREVRDLPTQQGLTSGNEGFVLPLPSLAY